MNRKLLKVFVTVSICTVAALVPAFLPSLFHIESSQPMVVYNNVIAIAVLVLWERMFREPMLRAIAGLIRLAKIAKRRWFDKNLVALAA